MFFLSEKEFPISIGETEKPVWRCDQTGLRMEPDPSVSFVGVPQDLDHAGDEGFPLVRRLVLISEVA